MHLSKFLPSRIPSHLVPKPTLKFRLHCTPPKQDAYEELLRLAVDADPSLASLASTHSKHPLTFTSSLPDTLVSSSKPHWLRQRGAQGTKYEKLKDQLKGLELSTVCQEAQCPNIGECWNAETGTATIMILGDTCTRGCRFCAVNTSQTPPAIDPLEPRNTAQAVASWDVGYIVITSVDRDDLPDGGAQHFCETVKEIKKRKPELYVECLSPDFSGRLDLVKELASSGLDVFAHNIETVHRLQSLSVLEEAKRQGVVTKSSLMLGLGETEEEIIDTMLDLQSIGVEILTLGQYLQPTSRHLPVVDFISPKEFEKWKEFGEETIGFKYVASGPLVRSSYRAGEVFIESILNQKKRQITNSK